jgi:hypothetical protein
MINKELKKVNDIITGKNIVKIVEAEYESWYYFRIFRCW